MKGLGYSALLVLFATAIVFAQDRSCPDVQYTEVSLTPQTMAYVITSMDPSIVRYEVTITVESPTGNGFSVKKQTRQAAATGGFGMAVVMFDVPAGQITNVEISCDHIGQW